MEGMDYSELSITYFVFFKWYALKVYHIQSICHIETKVQAQDFSSAFDLWCQYTVGFSTVKS